ncbi:MAG TPA: DUF2934 domain-containing protein [Methylophilaceae bacterium]|jgi:hypothetical protein
MASPKTTKPSAADKAVNTKPATAKRSTATRTATRKSAASGRNGSGKTPDIRPEERHHMVEVAAYFLAERNGFAGNPVEYWTAAERQISQQLSH